MKSSKADTLVKTEGAPLDPQGIIPQETIPIWMLPPCWTKGPPESPEQAPSPPTSIGPVQTLVSAKGSDDPASLTRASTHSSKRLCIFFNHLKLLVFTFVRQQGQINCLEVAGHNRDNGSTGTTPSRKSRGSWGKISLSWECYRCYGVIQS